MMPAHLLEAASQAAVGAVALAIAVAVQALASVLRTWIEQASHTRRLIKALEGSNPNQRPAIIIAFDRHEGLILPDKRTRRHRGD